MAGPSTPDYETMTTDQLAQLDVVRNMINKQPKRQSWDTSNVKRAVERLYDHLTKTFSEAQAGQLKAIVDDTSFRARNFRNIEPDMEPLYAYAQRFDGKKYRTWKKGARAKYVREALKTMDADTILTYKTTFTTPQGENEDGDEDDEDDDDYAFEDEDEDEDEDTDDVDEDDLYSGAGIEDVPIPEDYEIEIPEEYEIDGIDARPGRPAAPAPPPPPPETILVPLGVRGITNRPLNEHELEHLYTKDGLSIVLPPDDGLLPAAVDCFSTGMAIVHYANSTKRKFEVRRRAHNIIIGRLEADPIQKKLRWGRSVEGRSMPQTSPLWRTIPNTCLMRASTDGVMVIYGSRKNPTIDVYEEDDTIRGYYRVTQGHPERIHWRDFYSLIWWAEDDEENPKKLDQITRRMIE